MQSFKLATKQRCSQKCSGPKCRHVKSLGKEGMEKLYDVLLSGSYLLCSCLIVYSLLLLNTLMVTQDRLSPVVSSVAYTATQISYNTFAAAKQIGNPLAGTIDLYQKGLIKTFIATGNTLAKVPELLTWIPPVRARTNSDSYW